jgi:hypothetical protein
MDTLTNHPIGLLDFCRTNLSINVTAMIKRTGSMHGILRHHQ